MALTARGSEFFASNVAAARLCSRDHCEEWTMVQYARRLLYSLVLMFAFSAHASEPTLFYLDLSGQVLRSDANGVSTVVVNNNGGGPDGIAIDEQNKHIYWTNMGKVSADDGFILRANLDGSDVKTIVPAGG